MLETVLKGGAADRVLTGGLVGNILLAAKGAEIGKGSLDFIYKSNYGEYIDVAKVLLEKYADRIVLPEDLAWLENGERREAAVGSIPTDIGSLDIGSKTAENYRRLIESSATVFVNGPMGVFEQETTELGTKNRLALPSAQRRHIPSSAAAIASPQRPNTAKPTKSTISAPAAAH